MENSQLVMKWDKEIFQWTCSSIVDGMEYMSIGGSALEALENFKKEYGDEINE
jgi:hypothetical protein